jgi:hypothetical protein
MDSYLNWFFSISNSINPKSYHSDHSNN